jgi:hypothetical protein
MDIATEMAEAAADVHPLRVFGHASRAAKI